MSNPQLPKSHEGPSLSGFHFIQAYQNCKRKFYYQYVKGLVPVHRSPALLFGTAAHRAMEVWYAEVKAGSLTSKKVKFATDAGIAALEEQREQYYDPGKLETQKRQMRDTFMQYGLQYPNEMFTVIGSELSLETTLQYGDLFTGRVDIAVLWQDGRLMIMDHKFTGWSMESFKRSVQAGDQSTSYQLLWNRNNPKRPASGVIFNLIRNYQGSISFARVPVYRGQRDIEIFEAEVSENMRDLAQRLVDPSAVWPKNTDHCFAYNSACPFLDLCQGVKFDGLIGTKFTVQEEAE